MSIAIFIPSLAGGGAEKVAVILANEFAELGHHVHLVVATTLPEKYESEVDGNVNLVKLESSRLIYSVTKFSNFIKRTQPEVVLAIKADASIIAKFSLILAGSNKKTRLYVREAISNEFKEEGPRSAGSIIIAALTTWTYNSVDGIISPSSVLALSIAKKYPKQKNIRHINNPVVTSSFESQVSEKSFVSPWDESARIILSVGRLSDQKDYFTLLKAFRRLRDKADYKLMILGEGPERPGLLEYIRNHELDQHCSLPGFVPNPLPYLKQAQLFVLSSKYEGLPNVLIQALACGTRAVATDCPTGPAEILQHGRIGKLVPVGDSELLANAMLETLGASDISTQQRLNISEQVKNTYCATKVAKEFLDYLQDGWHPDASAPD